MHNIKHLIMAVLEHINSDAASGVVDLPEGRPLEIRWKEGVEDLVNITEDEIWSCLGLQEDRKLPFFQQFTDPDAVIEPWSQEGEEWLANPQSGREALQPCWHQLIGILRMLQRAFDGNPVLLMDGVGIGKTFQVIGFIACLAYFHAYYTKHGKFPGTFSESFVLKSILD